MSSDLRLETLYYLSSVRFLLFCFKECWGLSWRAVKLEIFLILLELIYKFLGRIQPLGYISTSELYSNVLGL